MPDNLTLREALSILRRTYKSIDIRALVTRKNEESEWLGIFSKVRLTIEDKPQIEEIHKKRNNDLAIEKRENCMLLGECRDMNQLDSTIDEFQRHEITIHGIRSQLRAIAKGNILDTVIQRDPLYSKSEEMSGYNHWFGFIPNDGGVSTWKNLIDIQPRSTDLPIEYELMGDWFDIPNRAWNSNTNCILIIMPIYIKRLQILCNNKPDMFVKYVIHPEILDEKTRCRIIYANTENSRVEKHQLKEFRQDESVGNMTVVLIPINTQYISEFQYTQIQIQIISEALGILFYDKIGYQDLKPQSANHIQNLILENAKKFAGSTQKLSFQNVDPFEYYIYQLLSISFPCISIGLFEGDWKKIFEQDGFSHTVDFVLFGPKSVLLIECTRQFTSGRSAVGIVELKKLLHVKEKFETYGLSVGAVLICAEYYKSNSRFFNSVLKQHPNDVHIIFKEGLEEIESQIQIMTTHDDILEHSMKHLES
jgi:hypothetical protein